MGGWEIEKIRFTVPNTAYIDKGDMTSKAGFASPVMEMLSDRMDAVRKEWEAEGLFVAPGKVGWSWANLGNGKLTATPGEVMAHLRDSNLYRYMVAGHGAGGSMTGFTDATGETVDLAPGDLSGLLPHRINELRAYGCESDIGSWSRHVAVGGQAVTAEGLITAINRLNCFVSRNGEAKPAMVPKPAVASEPIPNPARDALISKGLGAIKRMEEEIRRAKSEAKNDEELKRAVQEIAKRYTLETKRLTEQYTDPKQHDRLIR